LEILQRSDRLPGSRGGEIVDGGRNRARGCLQVRLQIAAADDSFFGLDIDQDDRPLIEQADIRNHRTA
jgi:hypothetical protein